MRFLIVISLILNFAINAQIVNKVLVSGIAGYESHDNDVKNAFLLGYASYNGTEFEGEIFIYSQNLASSFEYAKVHNYQMIVRSTTGLSSGIYYADKNPEIKLVMPAGSNSSVKAYNGDIETCPVIVTGAGNDKNVTGYNIDFYSIDPITENSYSSFSNGYIAGQIAFISNNLDCSIDEARTKARENGTEYGVWNEQNGYGQIDVEATINNAFEPAPVELTSFVATSQQASVVLNWTTATEVNNYGFDIQRSVGQKSFLSIGFVEGHGNSNSPKEYSFIDTDIISGGVKYRLKQMDNNGTFEYSDVVIVESNILSKTVLHQNYPNPFNPSTQINFTLAEAGDVNVSVYNALGEKVAELVNRKMNAGTHNVEFTASNLASGLYFYRLVADSYGESSTYSKTMKMMLIK